MKTVYLVFSTKTNNFLGCFDTYNHAKESISITVSNLPEPAKTIQTNNLEIREVKVFDFADHL